MLILVLGATGFIGSAIVASAVTQGHRVIATYHQSPPPANPNDAISWKKADLAETSLGEWHELLKDVGAVINCVGILQDNRWDSTRAIHVTGLKTLITACEHARVSRFIHFSAIGVNLHQASQFSATKRDGEMVVQAALLDWVILRPSVVVGQGAFGGSALFRGLAALPVLPVLPATAPLQIVQRDDVVRAVFHFLDPGAEARKAFDVVGPERLSMPQVIAQYRRWLGWAPARPIELPPWLAHALYRLGDFVRMLGWRPPVGSNARREMLYGAVGDPVAWQTAAGIQAQTLAGALARTPACVQERWFSRLYLLKPLAFGAYVTFWLTTGLISLTWGHQLGVALMSRTGSGALAGPAVAAGAVVDILVGTAIAFRPFARWGLLASLGVSGFYLLAASVTVADLWSDPLGPLVKVIPLVVFNLMLLAILDER